MKRRPFSVTLSIWLVLFLTVWNGLRLYTSLEWRTALVEFQAQLSPAVSALIGGVWMAIGLVTLYSILWRKAWAAKMLLFAATGYTVWYWTERLVWQSPRPNWPFAVILNLVLLLFIFLTTRSMTREAYERANKKQTSE